MDSKISDLTALTTPALEDLLVVVDDPSGTPTTKKLALSDLVKDEDDMASDSATALATQQSIKAYSDSATQTMTNKTLTAPTLNMGDSMPSTDVRCRANLSSAFSITTSSNQKIPFDTVDYDSGSDFDTTNDYFVAPVAGYYLITSTITCMNGNAGERFKIMIYVGATAKSSSETEVKNDNDIEGVETTDILYLSANDQVSIYKYGLHSGATIRNASNETYLSIHLLST